MGKKLCKKVRLYTREITVYVQDRKTGEGSDLMQDAWQKALGRGGGGG